MVSSDTEFGLDSVAGVVEWKILDRKMAYGYLIM